MQRSNFHTHSFFSDGHADMRTMAETALSNGFDAIGFSEHSYAPEQTSYCMKKDSVPDYIRTARELGDEFRGRIRIYAGVELDGDSRIDTSPFDFIIASVHEMAYGGKSYPVDYSAEVQTELCSLLFGGDMVRYSEAYFKSLTEHVARCSPDIVGHFDLVTKYSLVPERRKAYREAALNAAEECMKHCETFELNTGAIARGLRKTPYPPLFILKYIREHGGRVIVTSDCHYPHRMTAWFDEAERYLARIGFRKDEKASLNSKVRDIEIWY